MIELLLVAIIFGLMRYEYHRGRRDERRVQTIAAAQWTRRS